ncbi:hypothetical protein [Candidatus Sarmatiella mevalonica]|nr:hypothetical protein [Candidatus Sarmatiella mevalonica]
MVLQLKYEQVKILSDDQFRRLRTSHAKHLTNLFSIIFVKAN